MNHSEYPGNHQATPKWDLSSVSMTLKPLMLITNVVILHTPSGFLFNRNLTVIHVG